MRFASIAGILSGVALLGVGLYFSFGERYYALGTIVALCGIQISKFNWKHWVRPVALTLLLTAIGFGYIASSWTKGKYTDEQICPEYIVTLRGYLGLGTMAEDVQKIESAIASGRGEDALLLHSKADLRWGNQPKILELRSKVLEAYGSTRDSSP